MKSYLTKKPSGRGNSFIKLPFLILLIVLAITGKIIAQKSNDIDDLKNKTKLIYGSDDKLINGPIFLPEHYNALGSPFYLVDQWTKDPLYINGKEYHSEEIKYNIAKDRLVLNAKLNSDDRVMILLNNPVVDSFYIKDHLFVNASYVFERDTNLGFYELVYKNGFSFLIKHKKEFLNDYSESMPHGKYTNDITSYYIHSDDVLSEIPGKGALLKYFRPYKKEIKKFINSHKIRFKKATSSELFDLMNYITKLTEANE